MDLTRIDLTKRFTNACENTEPKTWPYTERKAGAFLLPVREDVPNLNLITYRDRSLPYSGIYMPGGLAVTDSPRTTMIEKVQEEMGISEDAIRVLGYLCLYPLPDAEMDAHIFIGYTPPLEDWELEESVVDNSYEIPLEYFIDEYDSTSFDIKKPEYKFNIGGEEEGEDIFTLPEATSRILSLLIRRVAFL